MDDVHPLKAWIDGNTSQAQFARELKISESHLSDILKKKKRPSFHLAVRMSRASGVGLEAIESAMPQKVGRAA